MLIFHKFVYSLIFFICSTNTVDDSLRNKDSLYAIVTRSVAELYTVNPEFIDYNIPIVESALSPINKTKIFMRAAQTLYDDILEIASGGLCDDSLYVEIFHPYHYYFDFKTKRITNKFWIKRSDIKIFTKEALDKKLYELKGLKIVVLCKKMLSENGISYYPGTVYFYDSDKNVLFDLNGFEWAVSDIDFIDFLRQRERLFLNHEYIIENEDLIRSDFVLLLRSYVPDRSNGLICPYVWGGTTIGEVVGVNNVCVKSVDGANNSLYYSYADDSLNSSIVGSDCSGIIGLVARIVGIPFFLRNTFTQKMFLKSLKYIDSSIKNGDILWFSRHTMVIDTEANSIIESVGYDSGGFGLRITSISDRVVNVSTAEDLLNMLRSGESLQLINFDGSIRNILEWDILSLIPDVTFNDI
jgi:hypothetical protein